MTSKKQLAANRRNAARSTGPRTVKGKIISAANALRHGLAASSAQDRFRTEEIQKLFLALKTEFPSDQLDSLVLELAEAEIDVLRARNTWHCLFESIANDKETYTQWGAAKKAMRFLADAAKRNAYVPASIVDSIKDWVDPIIPQEDERVPYVFRAAGTQLANIARYEDRAIGRRRMILQRLQRLTAQN